MTEIVLISHWFGHTPHCLECIVPFFLERGYTIYHLTDKPYEAEFFFSSTLLEGRERIRHIAIEIVEPEKARWGKDAQLCRVEAHWKGVRLALEKLYGELGRKVGIFHTWVDLYTHEYLSRKVIERAMLAPWVGIYVHPAEVRIFKTWKRRIFENLMDFIKYGKIFPSRLRAFHVLNAKKLFFWDEGVPLKCKSFFKKNIDLSSFPEIYKKLNNIDCQLPAELEKLKKSGLQILCLCGFLSKRKGLLTLVRAAKKTTPNLAFLFAGEIDWSDFNPTEIQEVKEFIKCPPSNIGLLLHKITDFEFIQVIQHSDIIYLAYENFFHSSGIQLKAAHFKKPIIAGPHHLIPDRTRKFQLGWCLPSITPQAVADLLNQIDNKEIQRVVDNARFEDFCKEHSPERLNKCLEEICRLVA